MNKDAKIFVAGHNGLVGSAIHSYLLLNGYTNVVVKSRKEIDLTNQSQVDAFFEKEKPEYVMLSAAKVGGIHANSTFPVEFGYINGMIQLNVLNAAHVHGVKKLLFLGSNCIYPKECPQPIKEEYLLSCELEKTNELYALAKILGVKMCESYCKQYKKQFISAMPCNLFGINDNFHVENSHLIPALIRKIYEAKVNNTKELKVWGTGKARREVLFSEDLAEACVFLMDNYTGSTPINVGTGYDYSITEIYEIISKIIGFNGTFTFDTSKPDGTIRKLLDVSKINNLGWKARHTFEEGVQKTFEWYIKNQENLRK
jgi:GDP-L-fucose synthase